MNIHPSIIIDGFHKSLVVARKCLEDIAIDVTQDEHVMEKYLLNLAKTTLSSKLLTHEKEHFSQMALDAVNRLEGSQDLELIHIIKIPGGSLGESFLDEGYILEKRIGVGHPKKIEKCKVMIANTPMDTDKIKIYGARVKASSFQGIYDMEMAEKQKMKEKVLRICKYGCNVFINRQLIYNYPEEVFLSQGVVAIEHADFDGMERLAKCLGAEIVSTFEKPERASQESSTDHAVLGYCDLIEEVVIGEEKLIRFSGCKKKGACTIVLRGGSSHVMDEAERSLHDAIASLSQVRHHHKQRYSSSSSPVKEVKLPSSSVICAPSSSSTPLSSEDALCVYVDNVRGSWLVGGGGSCEMAMSVAVERAAQNTDLGEDSVHADVSAVPPHVSAVPSNASDKENLTRFATTGKETLVMEAFARALRQIPTILIDNCGLDSATLVPLLKKKHLSGQVHAAIDVENETIQDAKVLGIFESFTSKLSQLCKAVEAMQMIVRVDDIIRCAPRERRGM